MLLLATGGVHSVIHHCRVAQSVAHRLLSTALMVIYSSHVGYLLTASFGCLFLLVTT